MTKYYKFEYQNRPHRLDLDTGEVDYVPGGETGWWLWYNIFEDENDELTKRLTRIYKLNKYTANG